MGHLPLHSLSTPAAADPSLRTHGGLLGGGLMRTSVGEAPLGAGPVLQALVSSHHVWCQRAHIGPHSS